jgi:hypothetical protein
MNLLTVAAPSQDEMLLRLREPAEQGPLPTDTAETVLGRTREEAAELVAVERAIVLARGGDALTLERLICAADPLHFITRWVDIESKFPLRGGRTVPFLLFPYQARIVRLYEQARRGKQGIFEDKSRQLGLSWLWMALFLHGILFEPQVSLFATSRREAEVDDGGAGSTTRSLFGRVRFMYEALPDFLRLDAKSGAESLRFKMLSITHASSGSYLVGEAATPSIGRGASFTAGLLDEFAHVEQSESAWASADEAIECPILSSTPLGEDNKFADFHKRLSRPQSDADLELRRRFLVCRSHWSEHPIYARGIERDPDGRLTSPWYRMASATKTPEKAAQEYDISYSGSLPGRYFPEFSRGVHVPPEPIALNRGLWLYLSCDHGLADTEIWGLWQTDGVRTAELVAEWHTVPEGQKTGADLTSRQVAAEVLAWLTGLGLGLADLQAILPDPSGAAREQTSGQSHHALLLDEWAKHGQYVNEGAWAPANNEVAAGIESTRLLMRGQYNGQAFTLRVSPTCTLTIDSLINYRRRTTKQGTVLDQEQANHWANHAADMVRYFCHTLFPAIGDVVTEGRAGEPYTAATRGRI